MGRLNQGLHCTCAVEVSLFIIANYGVSGQTLYTSNKSEMVCLPPCEEGNPKCLNIPSLYRDTHHQRHLRGEEVRNRCNENNCIEHGQLPLINTIYLFCFTIGLLTLAFPSHITPSVFLTTALHTRTKIPPI